VLEEVYGLDPVDVEEPSWVSWHSSMALRLASEPHLNGSLDLSTDSAAPGTLFSSAKAQSPYRLRAPVVTKGRPEYGFNPMQRGRRSDDRHTPMKEQWDDARTRHMWCDAPGW
jgi:hypothetical protein